MNWKLILLLSLFGLAMAFATVFWIPSKTEPLFWLVIFLVCAVIIASVCSSKYFLHGFLVSIVNSIWIIIVHVVFLPTYLSNHPMEAEMLGKTPMPDHPKLMMVITGLLIGVVSGLVLGVFAFAASRLLNRKKP